MKINKYANNLILRKFMVKHELTHSNIVELLSSKYGNVPRKTIERWIYDYTPMPGNVLELLEIKIRFALAEQQQG